MDTEEIQGTNAPMVEDASDAPQILTMEVALVVAVDDAPPAEASDNPSVEMEGTPVQDLTNTSNAMEDDFVTPKTTKAIKMPGRKKVVRVSASRLFKKSNHPSYKDMVDTAFLELYSRKGITHQAIKNYIVKNFKVDKSMKKVNLYVHKALDNLVEANELIKIEGDGGHFGDRYRLAPNSGIKKEKAKPAKKSASLAKTVKKLAKLSVTQSKKAATPSKKRSTPSKKGTTPDKKGTKSSKKSGLKKKSTKVAAGSKKGGVVKKRKATTKSANTPIKKAKTTPKTTPKSTSKATPKPTTPKKTPKRRTITPQAIKQKEESEKLKKALDVLSPAAAASKYSLRKKDVLEKTE